MLTLSAAAGLAGLCAGYARLTRPFLTSAEDPTRHETIKPNASIDIPLDPTALQYLPDDPWAAKATWIFHSHTGQSIIYFNDWKPVEKNTAIRLEPFAMIMPPSDRSPDSEPITIVGEAATLRVQGSLSLTDPNLGRITGGTIENAVRLRGPDALEINGSNFHFKESAQRIWSDDDVTFRQGANSGRGHGIQLDLFRVGPAEAYESVAVSGVKVFRLLRNVEMELYLGGDEDEPSAAQDHPSAMFASREGSTTPTKIQCAGSFLFDLRDNIARFDENVVASQEAPEKQPDKLECDTLEIAFEPGTPEARRQATARRTKIARGTLTEDDGFQSLDSELRAKGVVAQGHKRTARLHSPENEFQAEFETLTHDVKSGRTRLESDKLVVARQKSSRLECPTIELVPSDDSGPPNILCEGAGNLDHRDENGEKALNVYWKKRLTRSRQDDGSDLIQVVKNAYVHQPQDNFKLAAKEIDLWLLPRKPSSDHSPKREANPADSDQFEPHKLIARDNVLLRAPELAADANTLHVDFVDPPSEPITRRQGRDKLIPTSKRVRLASATDAATPPPAPPADQPAIVAPPATIHPDDNQKKVSKHNEAPPASGDTKKPDEIIPLKMLTDVINVKMTRTTASHQSSAASTQEKASDGTNRDAHVLRVDTTGGVFVQQDRRDGSDPLKIHGERLELLNRGPDQELVHIYGRPGTTDDQGRTMRPKPAQVHDGESDLWGMNINLDRLHNTAWVDGEGVLVLPVDQGASLMPAGSTSTSSTETVKKPQTDPMKSSEDAPTGRIDIRWIKRMDFDGKTATFLGDVRTSLEHDEILCQQLEVQLVKKINFASLNQTPSSNDQEGESDAKANDNQPEIATIYGKDRVIVNGGEYEQGQLIGRRYAEFSDLRVNQQSGATQASGPGLIKFWTLGEPQEPQKKKSNKVRANSRFSSGQRVWEYTHVDFAGQCDGNIRHDTITFHDDVHAVYGPVSDHTQELDPLRIALLPEDAGWIKCEHLTLTEQEAASGGSSSSQAVAEGNVRIGGPDFEGIADQVIFDESKGQYILKSFGDHLATIRMSGRGTQTGQAFWFYPEHNRLEVKNARGGHALPQ